MNLTEKAVEYLKASDRALGCGFGDKNGLTLVIRGKIGSGDIAFGIHALQRTLDCQNGDEIKLVTVDRYNEPNESLLCAMIEEDLYFVQIIST